MSQTRRLILTLVGAVVGWCGGWSAAAVNHLLVDLPHDPSLSQEVPLPHHVSKDAGGLSLRFAMIQDVIHERFPRHGDAYYRERNRISREKLDRLAPEDPERFPLADDLAAGLDKLGEPDDAVAVIREKLDRQRSRGLSGRELYTSFANLGTFLIHGNLRPATAGDLGARARFREGIDLIRQSVAANPEAHFGRERWQAAIAEFLLAAMEDPSLLTTYDCLGNRLVDELPALLDWSHTRRDTGYGRPYDVDFAVGRLNNGASMLLTPGISTDDRARWLDLLAVRGHITKIGGEEGWDQVAVPSHRQPVPFDEPMLGIVGMWRQGGGANPHFALAIGETMLRVGQRRIAWAAFERASHLAGRLPADSLFRNFLLPYCRRRQAAIESSMAAENQETASLRPQFEAELAYGEGFQRDYQNHEAARIAAGASITDEHFHDDFSRHSEPIATPIGPEEWFSMISPDRVGSYLAAKRTAWGVFGAGLGALLFACLVRLYDLRRKTRASQPRWCRNHISSINNAQSR